MIFLMEKDVKYTAKIPIMMETLSKALSKAGASIIGTLNNVIQGNSLTIWCKAMESLFSTIILTKVPSKKAWNMASAP